MKKKSSKMNFNFKKYNYVYDYSDIDYDINIYIKAKYIASIFLSDDDEMIFYYLKVLKIDCEIPLDISINDMMKYLHSNGEIIDFIYDLLYK